MMARIVTVILFSLFICACYAVDGRSPSLVVQKYCELDAHGVRISSATYPQIRVLMAWDDDRGEPGWDTFKVISDFKVLKEEISGQKATVTVVYRVLAEVTDNSLQENRMTETVRIQLIMDSVGWRIENYVPFPRLSVSTAIETLRGSKQAEDALEKLDRLAKEILRKR